MQGRKIPNDTWKKFPRVLAENLGSISSTAAQLGIDPRSVYYHMRRNPAFAGKIQETYDLTVVPVLEQKMFALALKGEDYRAIRFILSNRSPRRWNTEFVLRSELEAELARELKKIKEGDKQTVGSKYPSMLDLVANALWTKLFKYYGSSDDLDEVLPDKVDIDIAGEKRYYKSYKEKRKAHKQGRSGE